MRLSDFDFDLPEDRIALRPARPRDAARLLSVPKSGPLADRRVRDLPDLLRPGDLLVLNDTRTLRAALSAVRPARDVGGGGDVTLDLNLLTRLDEATWTAFARPAKRLRAGDVLMIGEALSAEVIAKGEDGEVRVRFSQRGADLDAAIETLGAPPLPPYIARKRAVDDADTDDYQTVFAERPGSVAAPTAGLHFTDALLAALTARDIRFATVTLHVGAGTFTPVKTDDVSAHSMHAEWFDIPPDAAAAVSAAKQENRRVVAVGTTSLRALEAAAAATGEVVAGPAETRLFITPGYAFQIVDAMMTNFHLPRSTLFMLVCAMAGTERMKAAYAHAVAAGYRFYSYGDACLLERA